MAGMYEIEMEEGALTLRTRFFRAGVGSLLHTSVFTPELTSSLAAGAVIVVLVAAALLGGLKFTAAYVLGVVILFVILFLFLRKFVFYEELLEVKIDKAADEVSVKVRKFMGSARSHRLSDLSEVKRGQVVFTPENPDGVDFVAKIAIQHGTMIPDFGETKTFNTVELVFKDGSKETVFSAEDEEKAKEVSRKIGEFVGGGVAQKD